MEENTIGIGGLKFINNKNKRKKNLNFLKIR